MPEPVGSDFCSEECADRWDAHQDLQPASPDYVAHYRGRGDCLWCWSPSRAALAERLAKEEG